MAACSRSRQGTNTLTTLVSFNNTNGSVPDCSLTLDSSGNLYGTTQFGGTNNLGTVFKITAGTNALTTLATFTGTNGQYPRTAVLLDSGGSIYGTTAQGGSSMATAPFSRSPPLPTQIRIRVMASS